MLTFDVLIEIFNLLDLKSQINMISIFHYLKNNIFITDIYPNYKKILRNLTTKILRNLTTKILKQKIFINVTKLNANYNPLITDISFMKKLKILYANGKCGID